MRLSLVLLALACVLSFSGQAVAAVPNNTPQVRTPKRKSNKVKRYKVKRHRRS